jgi:hypothetical protein
VLEDPEKLSDFVKKDQRFDGFYFPMTGIAQLAYERKTGQTMPAIRYSEHPVLKGVLTPESEMPGKYPRVEAKIGGCDDESLFD